MMLLLRFCTLFLLLLLGACAGRMGASPEHELLLRLAPASLGRSMWLQQHLVVMAAGRSQAVDVALEVDPQELRLAVLGMNQTVVRMSWDGQTLQQTRASWLPDVVRGERILSDLQLVWWPAEVVRAALPEGWTLDSSVAQRRLLWKGEEVMQVQYRDGQHVDVFNHRAGYQLQIESVEQTP
ncbi:Protein of unknown function [Rhodoferax sp. OV413]|uniref:DUF3261 domain-containing protein n=1 Tax=Rhodoferax sp. OV413 TaxID=1855285 RepID=UPI000889D5BD|nr:DUF3261 domain-containing protein [Rhodoferax sp. OV413]SDO02022.1 Protein of unknown function [Rhodoferax sp. OV413]